MSARILVLGAAGRLGHKAAETFRDAGWIVTSLMRPGGAARAPAHTTVLEIDALDHAAVGKAARGVDVVLHALNPPYTDWARLALPLAYSAVAAAETAGATLLFPGNLYNYGSPLPPVIDENTPMRPSSRKGQLRVAIEDRLMEAAERGVRTIILRAGEWAYLPDFASALLRLASVREALPPFASFGFSGHAVTGRELTAAITRAMQASLENKRMTWWLIHALRPIVPLCRELSEIAYFWNEPHSVDGSKLKATIGDIPGTPLDVAVARALEDLRAIA